MLSDNLLTCSSDWNKTESKWIIPHTLTVSDILHLLANHGIEDFINSKRNFSFYLDHSGHGDNHGGGEHTPGNGTEDGGCGGGCGSGGDHSGHGSGHSGHSGHDMMMMVVGVLDANKTIQQQHYQAKIPSMFHSSILAIKK